MSQLTKDDRLQGHALVEAVRSLPTWTLDVSGEAMKLQRSIGFVDFAEAFRFITAVSVVAEARNHHPEWLNVYNRVDITLTTHTVGGITKADIALAAAIDEIADKYSQVCIVAEDGSCGGCQ